MQRKTEEIQLAIQEYFDVDWFSMKLYMRRQLAKCVNECKSQASHAKKIVGTIKHHRSKRKIGEAAEANGNWESDDDFDYWDSDFDEDFDDEPEATSDQLSEHSSSTNQSDKTDSSLSPVKDLPGVDGTGIDQKNESTHSEPSSAVCAPAISSQIPHRNTFPRPPIKRPPSGPPPPPVPRPQSQETVTVEEYEVPISHPLELMPCASSPTNIFPLNASQEINSYRATLNHSPKQINGIEMIETYEIIEPTEENYEVVQGPPVPVKPPEKPNLPPRLPHTSLNIPPPPLPLKPKKLQDSFSNHLVSDGVRSLNRQKLPSARQDDDSAAHDSNHSTGVIGNSILSSFLGRRNSGSLSKIAAKRNSNDSIFSIGLNDGVSSIANAEKDGFFTVGSSAFISCTISLSTDNTRQSSPSKIDDSSQNFATRPLPPVPQTALKSVQNKQISVTSFPWFHEIEREDAEQEIQNLDSDGAFLVRPSKRAGKDNPYALTVLHNSKVFHLNIRLRSDETYALGKEKMKEKSFPTVADLISYHQREPILLTSRGENAGQTILRSYPEK